MNLLEAYRVLGVEPGASRATVREARHDLQRLLHPDKHAGAEPRLRHKAAAKSREVNEAFERIQQAGFPSAEQLEGGAPAPITSVVPAPAPGPAAPPSAPAFSPAGFWGPGQRYWASNTIVEDPWRPVYQAVECATGRAVALHYLRPATSDPRRLAGFVADCQRFQQLVNPHTLRLVEHGQLTDGTLFLVMEEPVGQSLAEVLRADAPLDWSRAAGIVLQLCGALAEAHANHVVHGRLGPGRIHLTHSRGGSDYARISFDVTHAGPGEAARPPDESEGYRAPEVWAGHPPHPASDVYAVGAIAFHMITGALPSAAPQAKRPSCPVEVEQLVLQCLHSVMTQRPDAEAVRIALQMCLATYG